LNHSLWTINDVSYQIFLQFCLFSSQGKSHCYKPTVRNSMSVHCKPLFPNYWWFQILLNFKIIVYCASSILCLKIRQFKSICLDVTHVLIYTNIENLQFMSRISDFQENVVLAFSYFCSSTYCSASFRRLVEGLLYYCVTVPNWIFLWPKMTIF